MNKAVFLDRDGTIIEEKNYLSKTNDIVLLPHCLEGLIKLQQAGYLLIIVTNQSGIARGYFKEIDVVIINKYIEEIFLNNNINISKTYYCPHHKNGIIKKYSIDCNCRKPNPGMIDKAIAEFNIDINNSYVIGDKSSDLVLATKVKCKGIIIKNLNYNIDKNTKYVYEADDILEAANYILKEGK